MCPLPREARKLLGVPLLATQTIYQYFEALNWGERQEQNLFIRISHLIELMVVVRFGPDTRSGLCDNWSVGL